MVKTAGSKKGTAFIPMQSPDSVPDRLIWLANIYRLYAADLQRYIDSKVGESFLAEDLTSIVFLKALRWLREDQSEESVRGWLYATARTTIADHWQAPGQHETRTLAGLEDLYFPQRESTSFAQRQAVIRVQQLLSLLPERERQVLKLRYLQGYSAAEIAKTLGTNAGHIRVLQLRALKHAAQLERQERNIHHMPEQETSYEFLITLLSPESIRVIQLARQEAQTLQHNFIGTEHLLWGLVSEGTLAAFLTPLSITPEVTHRAIAFIFNQVLWNQQGVQAASTPDEPPDAFKMLTPRAQQMIVLAGSEMKSQGEKKIRPTHLLLGMIQEGEGIGVGILRSLGINLLQVRSALVQAPVEQFCSFCGRDGAQVKRFFPAEVSSGNTTASPFICDKCVERFHAMLAQA